MASIDDRILFIKARVGSNGKELGDCPFSQRAFMCLKYKNAEFDVRYIDLDNKPEEFMRLSEGKGTVPVLKWGDMALTDSGDIVEFVNKEIPEPHLMHVFTEWSKLGFNLLPYLKDYLANQDEAKEEGLRLRLRQELEALDRHLAPTDRDYFCGMGISDLDLQLAPRLFHVMVASTHFKTVDLFAGLENLKGYCQRFHSLPIWKETVCAPEAVVDGWKKKLQL